MVQNRLEIGQHVQRECWVGEGYSSIISEMMIIVKESDWKICKVKETA